MPFAALCEAVQGAGRRVIAVWVALPASVVEPALLLKEKEKEEMSPPLTMMRDRSHSCPNLASWKMAPAATPTIKARSSPVGCVNIW